MSCTSVSPCSTASRNWAVLKRWLLHKSIWGSGDSHSQMELCNKSRDIQKVSDFFWGGMVVLRLYQPNRQPPQTHSPSSQKPSDMSGRYLGMLVGRIVVNDQVQLLGLRRLAIDRLEKSQPLLVPMELIGHG